MIEPNVKDIFLRKSILSLNKDLNILQMNGLEFEQQAYNKIASVQVVEIFDDEIALKFYIMIVFIGFSAAFAL